jgi:DNA-binding response OmpR family regulator
MKMQTATQTKILVVDDDDNFRETLTDAMSLKDVTVTGAESAEVAFSSLSSTKPSVILLDVQLPDANGVDLCRKIKADKRYEGVPVVLMSAKFTEPADRAEGLLEGADAYLSKPVGLDSLWEEIRYLLDRPS